MRDAAGNETIYSPSTETLLSDQSNPVAPQASSVTAIGQNMPAGYWNDSADTLTVSFTLPVGDPTLIDGFARVKLGINTGVSGSEYIEDVNIPIASEGESFVEEYDSLLVEGIPGWPDDADRDTLYTFILVVDQAGNRDSSAAATGFLLVDQYAPLVNSATNFLATGPVVVDGYYNLSNEGIGVDNLVPNDFSLENGELILLLDAGGGYTDMETTVITGPMLGNTTGILLDSASVNNVAGFTDGGNLNASIALVDAAGNRAEAEPPYPGIEIDFSPPAPFTLTSLTTTGGVVVDSFYNASNDGILFEVPIATDPTLPGGEVMTYMTSDGQPDYDQIGPATDITAAGVTINHTNTEAELELHGGFAFDGLELHFFVMMQDRAGNQTSSDTLLNRLVADRIAPQGGAFITEETIDLDYINVSDSLYAAWSGYDSGVSGLERYDVSVGHSVGISDFMDWINVGDSLNFDTVLTWVQPESYYLNLRAVDGAGNASDTLSTSGAFADLTRPLAGEDIDPYYHVIDWVDVNSFGGTYSDEFSGVDSMHIDIMRLSDSTYWDGTQWTSDSTVLEPDWAGGLWDYDLADDSLANRGNYQVKIMSVDSARNRSLTAVDTFQFVINSDPFFTDGFDSTAIEDSLFLYSLLADDPDLGTISGDTLYYSLLSAPDSMTVDSLTGVISWTPLNADSGEWVIDVRVTDALGAFDDTTFTIDVTQVNDAPEAVFLVSPADGTVIQPEDSLLLTFTWLEAVDIENDPLRYKVFFAQEGEEPFDSLDFTEFLGDTVDISEMDFPVPDPVEWYVKAYDTSLVSAVETIWEFTSSAAIAVANPDSLYNRMQRDEVKNDTFQLRNDGLTDLRWALLDKPSWITLPIDTGTIAFQDSSAIIINIDLETPGFNVGARLDTILISTNDPLQDTMLVKMEIGIFEVPNPILGLYANPAFMTLYELLIVDSLGQADSVMATFNDDEIELSQVDPEAGNYVWTGVVNFDTTGTKELEVFASNWVGDTTITSSVTLTLVKPAAAWLARSADEKFEVQGDRGSLERYRNVAVLENELIRDKEALYAILPDKLKLAEPILLRMTSTGPDQAIYQLGENGEFRELISLGDDEEVVAWTNRFGAFKLGPQTIVVPEISSLSQNYPNPFNPSTTIAFDIGFMDGLTQHVDLRVYNILGQEVRSLISDLYQPGQYNLEWDGMDARGAPVASGIYFARLMTDKGYFKSVKMLVLR